MKKHPDIDSMDVKVRVISKSEFMWFYREDHPNATWKVAQREYKKYYRIYGKQATHVYWEYRGATGRRVWILLLVLWYTAREAVECH